MAKMQKLCSSTMASREQVFNGHKVLRYEDFLRIDADRRFVAIAIAEALRASDSGANANRTACCRGI
jgi:hypothetical protein